jgi:homoserine dehydrogenase
MDSTNVAIVGLGTVGSGVAQILIQHHERVSRHAGKNLVLRHAVVQDLSKPRDCPLPEGLLTDDLSRITQDPEVQIVAQLMGGLEPARTVMLQLLESGKDIVTANKALLAVHGPELFERARELGRSIAFEASVAGGIPIITNIAQCLSANQITSLSGILNGTSNFIVSRMEEAETNYQDAVREAQQRGYAEADPTMDVDGTDAVQKLSILAHLAFGARPRWNEIPRTGIQDFDPADLRYARELGYRIKLLAVAQLTEPGLELHVSPTLVRHGTPLGEVRGAYNAVDVNGDAVGRVFFHGLGAGRMPTASAVMADMIDTALGRTQLTFRTLELWSRQAARVELADPNAVTGRYYLRLTADDHPGVLAEVTGILGRQQISIASVIQHEPDSKVSSPGVPLVIMTHGATEGAVNQAVESLENLASIRQKIVKMRVLD